MVEDIFMIMMSTSILVLHSDYSCAIKAMYLTCHLSACCKIFPQSFDQDCFGDCSEGSFVHFHNHGKITIFLKYSEFLILLVVRSKLKFNSSKLNG